MLQSLSLSLAFPLESHPPPPSLPFAFDPVQYLAICELITFSVLGVL